MSTALYFDTETDDYHTWEQPAQPVQVACVLSNLDTGRTMMTLSCMIVRSWPNARPIAMRVIDIHGITAEMCNMWGEPPQLALEAFRRMVGRAALVVAHNIAFDISVMNHAYATLGIPPVCWPPAYCTMKESAPLLRLPSSGRYSIGGYKAPKLAEAYRFFTERELTTAHDALADAYAVRAVHRGIVRALAKNEVAPAPTTA
jgi:DNA polymerase-3 subunit epsilon